jgi:mannose/fructose-specific phosphotransferase system component IIA
MKYKPQHVIVGENIPLLNENLLAQKMKLYSKNNENLEIVAIKSSLDNITDLEKKNFDLILAQDKSFKFFSKFNIPPKN